MHSRLSYVNHVARKIATISVRDVHAPFLLYDLSRIFWFNSMKSIDKSFTAEIRRYFEIVGDLQKYSNNAQLLPRGNETAPTRRYCEINQQQSNSVSAVKPDNVSTVGYESLKVRICSMRISKIMSE